MERGFFSIYKILLMHFNKMIL